MEGGKQHMRKWETDKEQDEKAFQLENVTTEQEGAEQITADGVR